MSDDLRDILGIGSKKMPIMSVPVLKPLVAVANEGANKGFWRVQLRDQHGNWVQMGGAVTFEVDLPDLGKVFGTGTYQGASKDNPNEIIIRVKDHPKLPDGDYSIPSENLEESAEAIIPASDLARLVEKGEGISIEQMEAEAKQVEDALPELKDEITGDEALKTIRSAVAKDLKAKGRFPLIRTEKDIEDTVSKQYMSLFEQIKKENPEVLKGIFNYQDKDGQWHMNVDIETQEQYWEHLRKYSTDQTTQWTDPEKLSNFVKVSNTLYAQKFLGIKPDGLITFYRNNIRRKNNEAEAAAGYASLDKYMAFDYNVARGLEDGGPYIGRYEVKARPDEVTGLLGFSRIGDEIGVVISPRVTEIPGRVKRVGNLEIPNPDNAPWFDLANLKSGEYKFDRSTGGSPFRHLKPLGQFDYYALDSAPFGEGRDWASFYEANGLKQGDLPSKYDELYGAGSWEKDWGTEKPRADRYKAFFKEFKDKDGKTKWGLEAQWLNELAGGSEKYANDPQAGDEFDRAIKVLSTMQELIGKPFFVSRGHDQNDPRLVEVTKETVEPSSNGNLLTIPYRTNEWVPTGETPKKPGATLKKAGVGGDIYESESSSDIIDIGDRKFVMTDIDGIKVPFYLSTGQGGKKDVEPGKWYPVPGIGPDGWINKSSKGMVDYYGSEKLRKKAEWLDANIGDIREDKSVPKVAADGRHIDFLNQDMGTPVSQKDGREALDAHIADFLSKIEGTPEPESQEQKPIDFSAFEKVSEKLGSNPGGIYKDPKTGKQYYVKIQDKDRGNNEALGSALYREAGLDILKVDHGTLNGEPVTYTEWREGLTPISKSIGSIDPDSPVMDGFAVDAWLANWDVVGTGYDNLSFDKDGNPVRLDSGGSLLYRARGARKGEAFGDKVGELDTFRDTSNTTGELYKDISPSALQRSVKKLEAITPERIDELVDEYISNPADNAELKEKLKARRQFILGKYDYLAPKKESEKPLTDSQVNIQSLRKKYLTTDNAQAFHLGDTVSIKNEDGTTTEVKIDDENIAEGIVTLRIFDIQHDPLKEFPYLKDEAKDFAAKWYQDNKNKYLYINSKTIQEQAKKDAETLGLDDALQSAYIDAIYNSMSEHADSVNIKLHMQMFRDMAATGITDIPEVKSVLGRDKLVKDISSLMSDPSVGISIDTENLFNVLDSGRFKSQFESGSSRGSYNPLRRATMEQAMMGVPINEDDKLRPIYGYVTFPTDGVKDLSIDPNTFSSTKNIVLPRYGSLRVILKPSVKDRTTFTADDSLKSGYDSAQALSGEITPEKLYDAGLLDRATSKFFLDNDYFEAQIHNGVSSSDIEKIIVPISMRDRFDLKQDLDVQRQEADKIKQKLKELGLDIPVEIEGETTPESSSAPGPSDGEVTWFDDEESKGSKLIDSAIKSGNINYDVLPESTHTSDFTRTSIPKEQDQALFAYSTSMFLDINQYLRDDSVSILSTKDYLDNNIKNLDALIDEKGDVVEDTVVYRGTSAEKGSPNHILLDSIQEGDIVDDLAYSSATKSPKIAFENFGPSNQKYEGVRTNTNTPSKRGGNSSFWAITLPAGSKALARPSGEYAHSHEKEVLLPRGSKFKINAIRKVEQVENGKKNGNFNYFIEATVVPDVLPKKQESEKTGTEDPFGDIEWFDDSEVDPKVQAEKYRSDFQTLSGFDADKDLAKSYEEILAIEDKREEWLKTNGVTLKGIGGSKKLYTFTPEEIKKAYKYMPEGGIFAAEELSEEQGKDFNSRMRALANLKKPGSISDETIEDQNRLNRKRDGSTASPIKVKELRHSAPASRFDEITSNGIKPKATNKVGSENYTRRRYGVFLANGYTSAEAGERADVFRVKVPESDLRVDAGYAPYGDNLYIERTIKPEELEHIGHYPVKDSIFGETLHSGRGAECKDCDLALKERQENKKKREKEKEEKYSTPVVIYQLKYEDGKLAEPHVVRYKSGADELHTDHPIGECPETAKNQNVAIRPEGLGENETISEIAEKVENASVSEKSGGESSDGEVTWFDDSEDVASLIPKSDSNMTSQDGRRTIKPKEVLTFETYGDKQLVDLIYTGTRLSDIFSDDGIAFPDNTYLFELRNSPDPDIKNGIYLIYSDDLNFDDELPTFDPDMNHFISAKMPIKRSTSEQKAIDKYTSSGYKEINTDLIENNGIPSDVNQQIVKDLDSHLDNSVLDEDTVLWRGLSVTDPGYKNVLESLIPGDTLVQPSYMSTSRDKASAGLFIELQTGSSGDLSVLMKINAKKGTKASNMFRSVLGSSAHEEEVLLPRGDRMTDSLVVTKVEKDKYDPTLLHIELDYAPTKKEKEEEKASAIKEEIPKAARFSPEEDLLKPYLNTDEKYIFSYGDTIEVPDTDNPGKTKLVTIDSKEAIRTYAEIKYLFDGLDMDNFDEPDESGFTPESSEFSKNWIKDHQSEYVIIDRQKLAAKTYADAMQKGLTQDETADYQKAVNEAASKYANYNNNMTRRRLLKALAEEYPEDELIQRAQRNVELSDRTAEYLANKISQEASIVIAIDPNNLINVLNDGRFKSQFEASRSAGLYDPRRRSVMELSSFGIPSDEDPKKRPIYGYVSFPVNDKPDRSISNNGMAFKIDNESSDQYGKAKVVLKDSAKKKTTFTTRDSLNLSGVPQPMSDATAESVNKAGLADKLSSLAHGLTYSGSIYDTAYMEAQIHGGVSIDDIQEIVLADRFDGDPEIQKQAEALRELIAKLGLGISVKIV
jgi:hypothetical protein